MLPKLGQQSEDGRSGTHPAASSTSIVLFLIIGEVIK